MSRTRAPLLRLILRRTLGKSRSLGGASERLGNVSTEEDCARAGGGWYYDDVAAPKRILACPETCTVIQSAADVKVQVLVGCKTVTATIR